MPTKNPPAVKVFTAKPRPTRYARSPRHDDASEPSAAEERRGAPRRTRPAEDDR